MLALCCLEGPDRGQARRRGQQGLPGEVPGDRGDHRRDRVRVRPVSRPGPPRTTLRVRPTLHGHTRGEGQHVEPGRALCTRAASPRTHAVIGDQQLSARRSLCSQGGPGSCVRPPGLPNSASRSRCRTDQLSSRASGSAGEPGACVPYPLRADLTACGEFPPAAQVLGQILSDSRYGRDRGRRHIRCISAMASRT